jgi:hypothetical protein
LNLPLFKVGYHVVIFGEEIGEEIGEKIGEEGGEEARTHECVHRVPALADHRVGT